MVFAARERTAEAILPASYILVTTEEIGQDKANDVSHIAAIRERLDSEPDEREILFDARIFHEHAVTLGSAYAIANRIECVLWTKNRTYAWA